MLRLNGFFDAYITSMERNRAWAVYVLTLVMVAFVSVYAFTVPQWTINGGRYTLWEALFIAGYSNLSTLLFLSLYGFAGAALWLTRIGNLQTGGWMVVAAWYVGGVWLTIEANGRLPEILIAVIQLMMLAALLQDRRGLSVTTVLGTVTLVIAYMLRAERESFFQLVFMLMNLLASGAVIWLFLRFFHLALNTGVSEAVRDNQATESILERASVLENAPARTMLYDSLKELREHFKYIQNARVFLVEGAEAFLYADTTQSEMNEQKQSRFGVGGLSVIGQVTAQGEAQIERGANARETMAVFPMRVAHGRVIGAVELRVDTRVTDPFKDTETAKRFQSFADKLAKLTETTRRFEALEAQIDERERAEAELRLRLSEMERVNQRMTGSVWSQYVRDVEQDSGLSVDFQQETVEPSASWTPTLVEARRNNHVVQEQREDIQVIAVPLRVRGQVVGAMEFEIDGDKGFTPEDLELLQEVSERFGLAAENTRLLEDSRRVAQREALVNQITTRLQSTTSVNATMLEAARSLREAVKANKVAIRLGKPNHGEASS
jgi:GAF domain-containing protein